MCIIDLNHEYTMSQVSRRRLTKEMESNVFEPFWSTIARINKKEHIKLFFTDFFTPVEKLNFAKRMSIAILLYKGYDYRAIRDVLKVSTATIGRVAAKFEDQGWKIFINNLEKQKEWKKFWHDMELLLWRFSGSGQHVFKTKEELEVLTKR